MIDIAALKDKSNLENFSNGQVIIEDGETACDNMYILIKGTAVIYKNYQESEELKIATLKPGDFFGEMSLFLNKERTATVVAQGDVLVLSINKMNAYDFFEKQPQMTYSLIKTLCTRLDATNVAYTKLYSETHPDTIKSLEPCSSSVSWLFPKGHKNYQRIINMSKVGTLNENEYHCPLCGETFTAKTTTVFEEKVSYDCQRPAKGRNDFYFEVITCPKCWYSNFFNTFDAADKKNGPLFERYMNHKPEIEAILNDKSHIGGTFASYWFALRCTPVLFDHCEEIMARLLLRLSWLYYDCKDEDLERYSLVKARDLLISSVQKHVFSNENLNHIYLIIGELSFKVNELVTAKNYFSRVEESLGNSELSKTASKRKKDIQQILNEKVSLLRVKGQKHVQQ